MQWIGEKRIEITGKPLQYIFPSSYFEEKQYRLIDYIPYSAVLVLASYYSTSCRYATILSLAKILLFSAGGPPLRFEPKHSAHPLIDIVFGPLSEEIEFRGLIQNFLKWTSGSPQIAIALSASLFGTIHLVQGCKRQAIDATMGGVMLGFLNYQFGLHAAITAHICNNLITTVVTV